MSSCGSWALKSPQGGLTQFYCGNMSCDRERCKKRFWSKRVRLITALIQEHSLDKFFTLTLERDIIPIDRSTLDRVDAWDYIHTVWSKFRKRMKRRYDFKFVAVLEGHKIKAFPHIHGFTNVFMWQKSWSKIWSQCGGGHIVWVSAVDTEGVSEYVNKEIEVAKYVGKEQLAEAYKQKRSHRTLWRSEKLKAKFELDRETGWSIIKETVYDDEGVSPFFQLRLGVNKDGNQMAKACSPISQSSLEKGCKKLRQKDWNDDTQKEKN